VNRFLIVAAAITCCSSVAGSSAAPVDRLPLSLRTRLSQVAQRARVNPQSQPRTQSGQLLAAVVAGLPRGSVDAARLGAPPPGWSAQPPRAGGHRWLYIRMQARRDSHQIAKWQAEIVAGAFRIAAQQLRLGGLWGVSITVVDSDRKVSFPSIHVIAATPAFPTHSKASMRRRIEARLSNDPRFRKTRVDFIHGYGPIPVVTLRFEPASAFSTAMNAVRPIFGDPFFYEGFLLKVLDKSGEIVRLAGIANGTGVRLGMDPR
jgi:hypothetical protein